MKIPKDIRDKRISEISNIYENALNDTSLAREEIDIEQLFLTNK